MRQAQKRPDKRFGSEMYMAPSSQRPCFQPTAGPAPVSSIAHQPLLSEPVNVPDSSLLFWLLSTLLIVPFTSTRLARSHWPRLMIW